MRGAMWKLCAATALFVLAGFAHKYGWSEEWLR